MSLNKPLSWKTERDVSTKTRATKPPRKTTKSCVKAETALERGTALLLETESDEDGFEPIREP